VRHSTVGRPPHQVARIEGQADSQGGSGSRLEVIGRTRTPTVSVVIPTFNEAPNLDWVLSRLPDCVTEVILVDGKSTDGTAEVAHELRPDAFILTHPRRGKGNALATGFAACHGDIIVMLDGDGSADPGEIHKFVRALVAGADFAKGTRFAYGGGSDDITYFRRLGNSCLVGLVNLIYGTRYTDLCYGLNAFWRRCLPAVAPGCDGFEVEAFMNLRAKKAGLRVDEVGSYEFRRRAGLSKLHSIRDGTRILRTILRERLRQLPAPAPRTVVPGIGTEGLRVAVTGNASDTAVGHVRRMPTRAARVALVNNMPDGAFASTDHQFTRLLIGKPGNAEITVGRYYLPSIRRGPQVSALMAGAAYARLDDLFRERVDAIVVTGTEPTHPRLSDEPFWPELVALVEWGLGNSRSLVLSCLAAHVAAELIDGAPRQPLQRKCLGVRETQVLAGAPLVQGLPPLVSVPHSHWNEVSAQALRDRGYQLLLTEAEHWTAAAKQVGTCLVVYYQGHPEYDHLTLLREFRRDWRRFHLGLTVRAPQAPTGYLDEAGAAELVHLELTARRGPDLRLVDAFPFEHLAQHAHPTWQGASELLYSNWISLVAGEEQPEAEAPRPLQSAWVGA
jgi:homoserine O-succinyltransferase